MTGLDQRWLLLVVLAFVSGCERYALDRKMEELCKQDGGVKVYETVTLSSEEYTRIFGYAINTKSKEDYYGPDYRYVLTQNVLIGKEADPEKGQGRLTRWYSAIYRRADGRLLGESVSYGRSGGDGFTFGFHPSVNSCPRLSRGLDQMVFLKGS